ncbi:MAG: response regulator transcription factor [Dehalococcoidia bacterium]|nr:response regulator transcription factor [Dehalococcoidia bacterium]
MVECKQRPDGTDTISVVIVEDHAVVREGTRRILDCESDISVIGEAGDGLEALAIAERLKPDVILLDIRIPLLGGIEVAKRLSVLTPHTKVMILSAYDDDDYVLAAMEAGTVAYLPKTVRAAEVVDAVRSVARGETVLHPSIARKIARFWRRGAAQPPKSSEVSLTPREMDVLRLVAKGLHNREIAEALTVAVRTVEGHIASIFAKLGVDSRTEAVVYGLGRHWLDLETDNGDG